MKVICSPRCSGKTTKLIYASEFNNIPILCSSERNKTCILEKAKELKLGIPKPIVLKEVLANDTEYKDGQFFTKVLVDDSMVVLNNLLNEHGLSIKGATVTTDSYD